MTEVKDNFEKQTDINLAPVSNNLNEGITVTKQLLMLSYAGEKGCTLVKSLKKDLQRRLPSNIQTKIASSSTKLFSCHNNSKDVSAFEQKHVVYHSGCATADCNADYIGECARCLNGCVKDHNS